MSEFENFRIHFLSTTENVRIGKRQNLNLSESENVKILQNLKTSESENVRILQNRKMSESENVRILQNQKMSESENVRILQDRKMSKSHLWGSWTLTYGWYQSSLPVQWHFGVGRLPRHSPHSQCHRWSGQFLWLWRPWREVVLVSNFKTLFFWRKNSFQRASQQCQRLLYW